MAYDYEVMGNIDAMELESVGACAGWFETDDCYEWGDNEDEDKPDTFEQVRKYEEYLRQKEENNNNESEDDD